jgi:hypothetical protein
MIASSSLATLLSMALLPLSGAAASSSPWDKCTAVSYDTLQATKDPNHVPFLGPKGLYASTTPDHCVYVAAAPDSDFALKNPKEFADFMSTVEKLQAGGSLPLHFEFLGGSGSGSGGAPSAAARRAVAGRHRRSVSEMAAQSAAATPAKLFSPAAECGDICGGNWDPSFVCRSCSCNVDQLICVDENTCTAVFRCK